jgi:hypothetical protein
LPQKGDVTRNLHPELSQITRKEILTKMQVRYRRAGLEYKSKMLDEVVELFGYYRKAAVRALGRPVKVETWAPLVIGRPKEYEPEKLLVILKAIWLAALQPCGKRLVAALPTWVPAYEQSPRRLDGDIDRRGATRPGTLLRQEIPIRTEWTGEGAGCLEIYTVALCGGLLDDRHAWMLDGVDIWTTWVEMRGLANRGQAATLEQIRDVEQSLPFALVGLDSDNRGEFINHHLVAYPHQWARLLPLSRGRPYRKNDNAHVEQKNYARVRRWFGYQRHDN